MMETATFDTHLECRDTDGAGLKFSGWAARYGERSHPGVGAGYEVIAPGAFDKTLAENRDVRLLAHHDPKMVLARQGAGTLTLEARTEGLWAEADLAPTTYGQDLAVLMRRGDVDGMSFGFRAVRAPVETRDGVRIRTLREVRLFEVSIVGFPAYPTTSAEVRTAALIEELRTGRVLSTGNAAEVRGAIDALTELLAQLDGSSHGAGDANDVDLENRAAEAASAELALAHARLQLRRHTP